MENNNELTLNELESVTGGTGFTAVKKTPKYAVGTVVRFNHDLYGTETGVIDSIEYFDIDSQDEYHDGYRYAVRNKAADYDFTVWLIALVHESQIYGVVPESEA